MPKYLEEINPALSAEDNIKNLCFIKSGFLFNEFDQIFSDLFLHHSDMYQNILEALTNGEKEIAEICTTLRIEQTGRLTEYLQELELSGFVKRDYTWHLTTAQDSKLSKYRLSDNYLRFYLKYINKYKTKIQRDNFSFKSLASLPEWLTVLGLQFENLVLNNRHYIHQMLKIESVDIISENPFFQRKTTNRLGCQIDYLIQTRFECLYICEIKFHKSTIGQSIVKEVQQKIDHLKRPRGFSCRPVLIHVNGVSEDVIESQYFANIIDFSQLLDCKT